MQQDRPGNGRDDGGAVHGVTVGIDLGDRFSSMCVLDHAGITTVEKRIRTTQPVLTREFGSVPRCRVVIEVGTHSPWVSRLLGALGHEVIVANPRRVRLIADSDRKHDRSDAQHLARLGRLDPALLNPVRHRSDQAQEDLEVIRSRGALARARTLLMNHVRGAVKAAGGRLPTCSSNAFPRKALAALPEGLRRTLTPTLDAIADLSSRIAEMEREIQTVIRERHFHARLLQQVPGVGPLTALTFVLTLDDPGRFQSSRQVGPYLGLTPRMRQSGSQSPQLPVSKAGDPYLRQLLVGSAHYILGPFGPDTSLRRWGMEHGASRRGAAKQRAVVAVARKLAVLLHRLWVTGEVYDPLFAQKEMMAIVA
jgi:transposase